MGYAHFRTTIKNYILYLLYCHINCKNDYSIYFVCSQVDCSVLCVYCFDLVGYIIFENCCVLHELTIYYLVTSSLCKIYLWIKSKLGLYDNIINNSAF